MGRPIVLAVVPDPLDVLSHPLGLRMPLYVLGYRSFTQAHAPLFTQTRCHSHVLKRQVITKHVTLLIFTLSLHFSDYPQDGNPDWLGKVRPRINHMLQIGIDWLTFGEICTGFCTA